MIGIIDYGSGNMGSIEYCLKRNKLDYLISANPEKLNKCKKILFPGVGNAEFAMQKLKEKKLDRFLISCEKPVFGICLGMQLLAEFSEEGNTKCLGIIPLTIKKFDTKQVKRVPHMGWNTIDFPESEFDKNYFYFVHSYYMPLGDWTVAKCEYGGQFFSAVVHYKNFWGIQFHPEKSGDIGEQFLIFLLRKH